MAKQKGYIMLSELNIINEMLSSTGLSPLTATDTRHPSYVKAVGKLNIVSGDVQNLGYWFNTTYTTLNLNENGEIYVPTGTLSIDTVSNVNITKRGQRLYNLDDRSFNFTCPLKVKVVTQLDFEDMPDTVKQYIRHKARYEFYLDSDGTEPKLSHYRNAVNEAWTKLYRENLRNRDTNYFDGPNAANMLARGSRRTSPYTILPRE